MGSTIGDFPDNAISTTTYFLYYVESFGDVRLDFLVVSHLFIIKNIIAK